MRLQKLFALLTAAAFVTLLAATPVDADCTGKEKVKARCKILNDGNNKLIVTVFRSEPNSSVEVRLDGVPIGDIETNSKGKGQFVRTNVGDGHHIVAVCRAHVPTRCER
ncbi:MAG: hypothetical protein C4547_06800 [Phycisphaerales bacterium]|nr:MAG: hypothetical protein C4547_06800 [Phycisphaerales bacterium]